MVIFTDAHRFRSRCALTSRSSPLNHAGTLHPEYPTGTRLTRVVLAYLALNIAIITLAPFRFVSTPAHGLTDVFSIRDAVLNIVLFLPLGFVYQLSQPQRDHGHWLRAGTAGLVLSGMIETAQVFAPERYPSLSDLITNALGAALGAVFAATAARRSDNLRTVRALALDLPLVGMIYLLLPVLWLTGLSAREGFLGALLLPLLSAAWIMASIHATYAETPAPDGGDRRLLRLGSGAALFLVVGLAPAMQANARLLLWGGVLFAVAVGVRLKAPALWTLGRTRSGGISRRFEGPTLRVALAPLVGFAAVLSLGAITGPFGPWQGTVSLTPGDAVPSDAALFRAMAIVATYTTIGYGVAALHGRRHESLSALIPRTLLWALTLALPIEILRGWGATTSTSVTMLALSASAATIGAVLYQLQLRHIQALLGRH
jgi:glycopeptide antibiotics resistance protein